MSYLSTSYDILGEMFRLNPNNIGVNVIKTINYYTHIIITLPTTLKEALLLPDPVNV